MEAPLEYRIELPGDPGSPIRARRLVRSALQEAGQDGLIDDAVLLTSELCENSVLHAGTAFDLAVTVEDGAVTVAVTDQGSTAMELRRGAPSERRATHNRGLLLVDTLANAWGSRHDEHGHQVWFTLRANGASEPVRPPTPEPATWPDPDLCRWLLHLPNEPLPLPTLVTELLRRLCDVLGAAGGTVVVGDLDGTRELAEHGRTDPPMSTVDLPLSPPRQGKLHLHGAPGTRAAAEVAALSAARIALAIELDHTRGTDRERRAWLAYLAEASELLGHSLDVRHTAAIIPQIVVPRLGLWCAVHLLDERGQLELSALTHADETELSLLRTELDADRVRDTLHRLLSTQAQGIAVEPPLRAIAVPLVSGQTTKGTLTVGHSPAGPSGPEATMLISDLARRAAQAIDNAQRHITHVATSQALQKALLPRALPTATGLRFAAAYLPASLDADVGGDFYDILALDEHRWLTAVGDVCGKGPRAAARTSLVRDVLRVLVRDGQPLDRAVRLLNELMLDSEDPSQFATVALALLSQAPEPAGDVLVDLVLAGHEQPVLAPADGPARLIGEHGTAVGLVEEFTVTPTRHVLHPGDTLVFYTDGVIERRRGNEQFGHERLLHAVTRADHDTPEGLITNLRATIDGFSREPQRDDIAIIAVHVSRTCS